MMTTESLNGSGPPREDFSVKLPTRGFDLSRGTLPLLIVFTLACGVAIGAFNIGRLFSQYEIERGSIFERLGRIEAKLDNLFPAPLKKQKNADKE
jgi:hypothetical protein